MNSILRDRVDALTKAGAKAALQQLRLALQQSQKDDNIDSMAWALLHTAMVLRGQRKLASLTKILNEALSLFNDVKNDLGRASTLYELSVANREMGRNMLALEYGFKAAELFKTLDRMVDLAWGYSNLSIIYFYQSQRAESLAYAKKAHGIFIEFKSDNGLAWNACNLAMIYLHMGFLDQAIKEYNEAIALFERVNSRQGHAWALLGLGIVQRSACRIQEAEATLSKSKQLFTDLELPDRIGWCLLNLAALKRMSGQQDEATRLNKEAIQMFTPLRNHDGVAWGLFQMGQIYRDHGHLVKAWHTFREAHKLHSDIANRAGIGWDENEMGETYLEMGDLAHARECFVRARVIAEQLDLPPLKADVERNVACLYIEEGLIQKAAEALTLAEQWALKCEERSVTSKTLLARARLWVILGDAKRARESIESANVLIESTGLQYLKPQTGILLGEVLVMENRAVEAIETFMNASILSKKLQQRRHRAESLLGVIQLQRRLKGAAALALSLFYVEKDVRAVGSRKLKSKFLAVKGVLAAQPKGTLDNRYFHQSMRGLAASGLNVARKQLLDMGLASMNKSGADRVSAEYERELGFLMEKGPVDLHLVRPRSEWVDALPLSLAV